MQNKRLYPIMRIGVAHQVRILHGPAYPFIIDDTVNVHSSKVMILLIIKSPKHLSFISIHLNNHGE